MMQVVIEISKDYFERVKYDVERGNDFLPYKLIANGTPLSKGHGRISDMDEAIKCIEEVKGDDAFYAISLIEWACGKRTIIEADKESEG